MKTVLYFKASDYAAGRRKVASFMSVSASRKWNVHVLEPIMERDANKKLVDFWKPDGIVINCAGANIAAIAPDLKRSKIPVVLLDRPADCTLPPRIPCVYHDSRTAVAMAVRELLSLDLKSYAFIGGNENTVWDRERETYFRQEMALNGHDISVFRAGIDPDKIGFRYNAAVTDDPQHNQRGIAWLKTLPLPVGIFAVTDVIASKMVNAAVSAGFNVPQDLCVVGIDNDENICEYTTPTLTSVESDWDAANAQVVELLDRMMSGAEIDSIPRIYFSRRLVRRTSTQRLPVTDHQVEAALEKIRLEATEGLTAAEVLSEFDCSRRMAEIRFRKLTGRSVLEAIQSARLEKAKELLASPQHHDLTAIANFCGYSSAIAFSRFFRAETGMSPGIYRKSIKLL